MPTKMPRTLRGRSAGIGRVRVVAVVVALLILPVGCTDVGGSSAETPDTFTFALTDTPNSLDLAKSFNQRSSSIMSLVTQKLELVSAEGELSPGLATKVSHPDDTTLVYEIQEGLTFSDGTELTADDVAWSFEHAAKAPAQSAGLVPAFEAAEATGPLEVTVTLKSPDQSARVNLAVITFVQESDFAQRNAEGLGAPDAIPVGSGPYQVESFTTQAVTLTPNPEYAGEEPPLSRIEFAVIPNDTSALQAMRSGDVQGRELLDLKSAMQWEGIEGATVRSMEPALISDYLTLNVTEEPWDDVHLRRALAYAIDDEGIANAAYGEYAEVLSAMVAPEDLIDAPSESEAVDFVSGLTAYEFDLAKAREELSKSAYPDGLSVTIPYLNNAPWSQLTVLNLQENLKQIGVDVTPKGLTQSQWVAELFAKNGIQTAMIIPPIPGPSLFLTPVTTLESPLNAANWTTPEVEEANQVLITSTDQAERWEAIQTILTAIAEEAPYIPLYSPGTIVVLGGGFAFADDVTLIDLYWNGTWVDGLQYG